MERDRLDNLLRQKLKDNRMTPPPDLWSKIEADLESHTLTESDWESDSQTPSLTPSRKIALWRYAAAACLALALVANFYLRKQEPPLTAQRIETVSNDSLNGNSLQKTTTPESSASSLESEIQVQSSRNVSRTPETKRQNTRIIAALTPSSLPAPTSASPVEKNPYEINTQEESAVTTVQKIVAQERSNFSEEQTPPSSQTVQPTDDTPTTAQEPEWYRDVQKEDVSSQRRKTVRNISATLYADNLTGGDRSSFNIGTPQPRSNGMMMESVTQPSPDNTLTYRQEPQKSTYRHRTPVTFGANVSFRLSKRFALETGLLYTHLHSETETQGAFDYHIEQDLDYLGIPLSATYTLIASRYFDLYLRAGATAEALVSGRQEGQISRNPGISSRTETSGVEAKGLQTSIGAAAGAMFNISRTVGLYLEPGISHYFENHEQPASYRTEHPTNFNLRAGIRISFR